MPSRCVVSQALVQPVGCALCSTKQQRHTSAGGQFTTQESSTCVVCVVCSAFFLARTGALAHWHVRVQLRPWL